MSSKERRREQQKDKGNQAVKSIRYKTAQAMWEFKED